MAAESVLSIIYDFPYADSAKAATRKTSGSKD